jgi:polyphosphate kinase 2 (PPK2 family)
MKIRSTDFRVEEGHKVNLDKWPTAVEPIYESKKQYQKILADHVDQLSSLQQLLYASSRYAVLLIFQAMDAAGKDGAIRHVMSGVNPQGCQVFSYKHPSAMELQHDFLWRTTRDLPEREGISIFNRPVIMHRPRAPKIPHKEGIAGGSLGEKTVWKSDFGP